MIRLVENLARHRRLADILDPVTRPTKKCSSVIMKRGVIILARGEKQRKIIQVNNEWRTQLDRLVLDESNHVFFLLAVYRLIIRRT